MTKNMLICENGQIVLLDETRLTTLALTTLVLTKFFWPPWSDQIDLNHTGINHTDFTNIGFNSIGF